MLTSTPRKQEISHPRATLVACALLLAATAACESDHGNTSMTEGGAVLGDASDSDASQEDVGQDGSGEDATPDAETDSDAGEADASSPLPPDVAEGAPCDSDDQCDDHIYCNGDERCAKPNENADPVCQPALQLPCSTIHPCREARQDCDCDATKDHDKDSYTARECGGPDCNDSRADCFPGGTEVCDANDEDEDCEATTFNNRSADGSNLDGDADGDGFVDKRCRNRDPDTGGWHGGTDCLDREPTSYPGAQEICDYFDNNCNGFVDERTYEDGSYDEKNNGLRNTFVPDRDGDLHGDAHTKPIEDCIFIQPPGYILATNADDCDDDNPAIYAGATEVCDGADNDCDEAIDQADDNYKQRFAFPETVLDCRDDHEVIVTCPQDKLWCPENGDPIEQGCRSDGTLLTSCRRCDTDCKFSCGREGCDEIVKLSLGANHSCAITQERKVACWGQGSLGRLGNDTTKQSSTPVPVTISDVRDISAGYGHTCAIVGDTHDLYCWGDNASQQLGQTLDGEPYSAVAVSVKGAEGTEQLTGVRQVSAGRDNTCAVLDTGSLVCFGLSLNGMIANGQNGSEAQKKWPPVLAERMKFFDILGISVPAVIDDAVMVALGGEHGCVLTRAGTVECWGRNTSMQLGIAASNEITVRAAPVPGLSDVTAITAGRYHTCALLSSGEVSCWGENRNLQLGAPNHGTFAPQLVPGLQEVAEVAAGQIYTCARKRDQSVVCWGANEKGQLGISANVVDSGPATLPTTTNWSSISLGAQHTCGRPERGPVQCWGANSFGQLGTGVISLGPAASPVPIQPVSAF